MVRFTPPSLSQIVFELNRRFAADGRAQAAAVVDDLDEGADIAACFFAALASSQSYGDGASPQRPYTPYGVAFRPADFPALHWPAAENAAA
ncbi:MAG: hypothetical protein ABR863_07265 [Roseiarcus sp.]